MRCLKKKDGSLSVIKMIALSIMLSFVVSSIGNFIGNLFEGKSLPINDNKDNE